MVNVPETPTQSGMDAPKRVMVVYGSESGNAKRGIDRMVKKWTAKEGVKNFEIVDTITGNAMAKRLGTGDGTAQAKNLEFIAKVCEICSGCQCLPRPCCRNAG